MHDSTISMARGVEGSAVPPWVFNLIGRDAAVHDPITRGRTVLAAIEGDRWSLVTVRVPEAAALDRTGFQRITTEAYSQLRIGLDSCEVREPVRIWNFIPAIRRRYAPDIDQYMAFNAGRYAAFSSPAWYGRMSEAERIMPTATGVGHDGEDLVIHLLAGDRPGRPVENPRQVSAYHYSRRYGPRPPCFARATVVEDNLGRSRILIGGTASVVGEDSRHELDARAQVEETLTNLQKLLAAAPVQPSPTLTDLADVRIYYVQPADLPVLQQMVGEHLPAAHRAEWVRADLCRPELLIEIEGVA